MKAVILAAGQGTRMAEITKDKPKPLIEINGKTILKRQLEILFKNNFEKIIIVVGYKAEKIKAEIKNKKNIEIIENIEYKTTDNIYSLYLAKENLKGEEFILLNGDTVFDEEIIKKIVTTKNQNITPVDSKHYDLEELKIKEKNGFVVKILPKSTPKSESDGSTIGIFKFSSEGSNTLFNEIERLTKEGVKNKWFEYALNNVLKNIKMYKMDIRGLKWIEIDTVEDVEKSQMLFG